MRLGFLWLFRLLCLPYVARLTMLPSVPLSIFSTLLAFSPARLLPRSCRRQFSWPGMLHLTHNAGRDLVSHLSHWDEFWEELKQVCYLWSEGRKERFLRFCVHPLLGSCKELEQCTGLSKLYTKRQGAEWPLNERSLCDCDCDFPGCKKGDADSCWNFWKICHIIFRCICWHRILSV